jgi:hypothetical protein
MEFRVETFNGETLYRFSNEPVGTYNPEAEKLASKRLEEIRANVRRLAGGQ